MVEPAIWHCFLWKTDPSGNTFLFMTPYSFLIHTPPF